jgi:hypothetical protein
MLLTIHVRAGLFYPVRLTQLIESSDNIVEAQVQKKTCFIANHFIYTDVELALIRNLKGQSAGSLHLIIEGGTVDSLAIVSSAEAKLDIGEIAIFVLEKVGENFELTAHAQSVFRLDIAQERYSNPYFHLDEKEISELFATQSKPSSPKSNITENLNPTGNPLVLSISPLNITAGTESILTIIGTGFGSAQTGKVFFANPDDAGSTYVSALPSKIQTWTDTKITIAVPSQAGNGNVWVQQNGVISKSSQKIEVAYSRSNAETNNYQFPIVLVNQKSTGGYLLSINQAFQERDSALNNFNNALQNWRCKTGVNFTVSDSTALNTRANDNISIVRFANNGELKQGVLGITYSYYSSCSNGYWYLTEFDMNFLDTNIWNYDSSFVSNKKFDFESVVLHELGHAHQLSHAINPTNIMHYSIGLGSNKRVIDNDSYACAQLIINDSKKNGRCGPAAHQIISSEYCNDISFAYYNFENPICYPNPSDELFNISFNMPSTSSGSIELFDVMGQQTRMLVQENFMAGKNLYTFPMAQYNLHTGVYLLKITALNKSFLKKIIYLKK